MASALARFEELLTEAEVCQRFAALVSDRELREARRRGEIAYLSGKKGKVLYHPDAVADYLRQKEKPCQSGFGNMADTGSAAPTIPQSFMPTGTTGEQDRLVAERLAQKFSSKRKTALSPSSDQRSATATVPRIVS